VTATDDALKQLDTLLDAYSKVKHPAPGNTSMDEAAGTLVRRLGAAIDRLSIPGSAYARDLEDERRTSHYDYWSQLEGLITLARALRDDIAAGWMVSVVAMAHADTYADYLEMAEGLSGQGYKDAAAVIAGTSLEVQLKALAVKHSVNPQAPNGGPKKMDAMNAELRTAGVYNALEHKQVTAWLAIRNSAAHGNYDDYDAAAVRGLIIGVRDFAAKYPA
jgi:hypothetical protein